MEITAEIIPHAQFHSGRWLLPLKRPAWYYFLKKQNNNTIRNRLFIKSVDEPLRELVLFLHERGFKTTPSCAGHFKSEKSYGKVFESLEKDKNEITGTGLELTDIQTGKVYFLKNKNYFLPWRKEVFVKKIFSVQQNGILGIRFGNITGIKKQVMRLQINAVKIEDRQNVVFVQTRTKNREQNKRTWQKITSEIKNIFP